MIRFYLYRLKVENTAWLESSPDDRLQKPGDIILSAIKEKPSREIKNGPTWHIGNIQKIADKRFLFALGKVTRATRKIYNKSTGDFTEEDSPDAPHTHVVVDLNLQVCAIAHDKRIDPQINRIAKNLERLLNESREILSKPFVFNLDGILNPEKFLDSVKDAKRITRFEMTLEPPNPVDVNKYHKAMKEYLRDIGAGRGKFSAALTKGKTLNLRMVEKSTRSAMLSGNEVRATIQTKDSAKATYRRSGNDLLTVCVKSISSEAEKLNLFSKIESTYYKARKKVN